MEVNSSADETVFKVTFAVRSDRIGEFPASVTVRQPCSWLNAPEKGEVLMRHALGDQVGRLMGVTRQCSHQGSLVIE